MYILITIVTITVVVLLHVLITRYHAKVATGFTTPVILFLSTFLYTRVAPSLYIQLQLVLLMIIITTIVIVMVIVVWCGVHRDL